MKYKLNYDWNRYEKGHVFEADPNGTGYINYNNGCFWKNQVGLLVLSGALTEVNECVCIIGLEKVDHRLCPVHSEVKGGVDLGNETTCATCCERYCKCPQRQPDGSWKCSEVKRECFENRPHNCHLSEVKKIEKFNETDFFELPVRAVPNKINELVDAVNLINTKLK